MFRQLPAQAAGRGDEVDDALDAVHVRFLPGFDLRVDGGDDVVFFGGGLREGAEDAEAVHDAAGVEVDGADGVPCLQGADCVGAWEVALLGGEVDVDVGVFVGGFAVFFERFGDGGGGGGEGFEGGGFDVFVFGVFGCDGSDEVEAEFELRVEEVQCVFLWRFVRALFPWKIDVGDSLGCPTRGILRLNSVR